MQLLDLENLIEKFDWIKRVDECEINEELNG